MKILHVPTQFWMDIKNQLRPPVFQRIKKLPVLYQRSISPVIFALPEFLIVQIFQPGSPCRHHQYRRMPQILMIFQHIPAGKSHNRDILRIIPELSHHNIPLKSRRRGKISHRTGPVPAEKLFHPFQSQHSMLQKIYIMAVDLPGDQVRLRLPEIPVDPAVRSHIKPGRQHIENVAETHKGDHVSPVFLHRRPLGGIPVQYKENSLPILLFQILHAVPKKIKTVVLGRKRVFLKHHPDTFLIPQRPQDTVQTKGKKFFQSGARAVVLRCRTASQDQPMSHTSHGKENPPFSPVFIISQDQTHPEASAKNDRMQR